MPANVVSKGKQVGRYALGQPIAAGGMATLHLGRLVGSAGFARMVAIKRLHPHLCANPNFVEAFADEARLAARIRHPNVVPTLDVVSAENELLLVMEYIDGESLSALARGCLGPIPTPIIVAIVSEMLHGLHSAHEAKSEAGLPLEIVHRDVSPQNVLVGADGAARLVDFGIARATGRVGNTDVGDLKGKLAYMAPEQIRRERVTRKTDIFAAGVVLWELLTGTRLFASENEGATVEKILVGWVAAPSSIAKNLPRGLDEIALRALDADPANRYETAREMAMALEDAVPRALGREVATWVEATAGEALASRRALVVQAERCAEPDLTGPVPSEFIARENARENARETTPHHHAHGQQLESTQMLDDADIIAATRIVVETEGTITAFTAGALRQIEDVVINPTWQSGSIPPPPPARRGFVVNHAAIVIFAVAATVTTFFGARYSSFGSDSAATTTESAPLPTTTTTTTPMEVVTAASAPAPTMTTMTTMTTMPVNTAPLAMGTPHNTDKLSAPLTPAPLPAQSALSPAPRRQGKLHVAAPARAPCVAKLDPATGKKVYQGDCD